GPVTGTIPSVDRAADAFREMGMSRCPWWRPGGAGVICPTSPGLDPSHEIRGLRPRPPPPRRRGHAGTAAGHPALLPAGWSWAETSAGWTPHADGSLRAPARTGALREAGVTNG